MPDVVGSSRPPGAPDGYLKCPKAGCPRWMHPDRTGCWTCLNLGFTESQVLPGHWDWTPPSLNAETTRLVENVRRIGAGLNAALLVKAAVEGRLRDEEDKIRALRFELARAEELLRDSLFAQVDVAKAGG